ncbi:MAG: glycosyltransferase [Candidatus Magasanikbacteria bacterium]|nr:glycosyltransferase [Candidatus Magasanikbacteria bacterium]
METDLEAKKINIKYITNARMPTEKAHGYQICKMCEDFSNCGVEIELIVPKRDNHIKETIFGFYNLEKNYSIKKIKSFDFFKLQKVIGSRLSHYLQSLTFLFHLCFLKVDGNEIIYTRNPGIIFLFKMRGCKTVYECHDWFSRSKILSLFFLKKCDFIITTNNFIKKEFLKNKFNKDRLCVAPNGVNLEMFDLSLNKKEAVEKLSLDKMIKDSLLNNLVLLYTGSFRTMGESKGIDEILEALVRLKNKNIIFIAVGGNKSDIKYYESKAKNLNLKNALFLDKVNQNKLAIFQKASDILLMPFPNKAHYKYFMTPLKTFEYMASKRPIIASDLPSIREILDDNTALFCRPDSIDSLVEKINDLISNKNLVERITKNAYTKVQQYTWKKRAQKILNFIK